MSKKILLSLIAAVTILLSVVVALRVSQLASLLSELPEEIDFEEAKIKTVGIGELEIADFLPIVQLFIGKAVSLEEVELPAQPATVTAAELTLTLPAGWDKEDEYTTDDSYAVLLRDKDGNFATISRSTAADPETFLSNIVRRYFNLLELSGFAVIPYTLVMPDGQLAQAIDAQGTNLVVQLRAWVPEDSRQIYLVVLTSRPEDLMVSRQIFESFSY